MEFRITNLINGDVITSSKLEGSWDVRYINRSENFIEVSDEDDTVRHIVYPREITSVTPFDE